MKKLTNKMSHSGLFFITQWILLALFESVWLTIKHPIISAIVTSIFIIGVIIYVIRSSNNNDNEIFIPLFAIWWIVMTTAGFITLLFIII